MCKVLIRVWPSIAKLRLACGKWSVSAPAHTRHWTFFQWRKHVISGKEKGTLDMSRWLQLAIFFFKFSNVLFLLFYCCINFKHLPPLKVQRKLSDPETKEHKNNFLITYAQNVKSNQHIIIYVRINQFGTRHYASKNHLLQEFTVFNKLFSPWNWNWKWNEKLELE